MDADPGPSCPPAITLASQSLLLLADGADGAAGLWLGGLVLVLLLLASALISGSEVAYFSLNNADVGALREDDGASARRIVALKQEPHQLLATILITNNFVNIAIVLLSEFVLRAAFPEAVFARWEARATAWAYGVSASVGDLFAGVDLAGGLRFSITVIGVTFLLVLFGEVTPKVYARAQNVALARFMSAPLRVLLGLFRPLSATLVRSGRFLEDRLRRHQGAAAASREELDEAIDLTVRDEAVLAGERDILKRLVTFGDVTVRQIMQGRPDVVAISREAPFAELLALVKESSYSRIPVYEEDLDKVVGIVYAKDLIRHLREREGFDWGRHVRPDVMYVPESKKIHELLREFQAERTHMAIVVDEFGGTSGLVTLEDILEEVIGDIKDEFDEDLEIDYVKLDERTYQFEGKTQLSDALRLMGLPKDLLDGVRGDADTVAGVILEQTGTLPRQKETMIIGGIQFVAEVVNRRRIERVRILLPHEPAAMAVAR